MRFFLSALFGNSLRFRSGKYLFLAIIGSLLAHQVKSYASPKLSNTAESGIFVSLETTVFILIGVVISFFYIKGMAGVLSNAVRTYSTETKTSQDTFTGGITNTLLAVIASAVVIWSYGLGAYWLYLGPILCLLSPIGIVYFMFLDVKAYKQSL